MSYLSLRVWGRPNTLANPGVIFVKENNTSLANLPV